MMPCQRFLAKMHHPVLSSPVSALIWLSTGTRSTSGNDFKKQNWVAIGAFWSNEKRAEAG